MANISANAQNRLTYALGDPSAGAEVSAAVNGANAVAQNIASANQANVTQTQTALTDSTGGTPSTTLAAITAGADYAQADATATKNGLASLAAELALVKADVAALIVQNTALRAALVTAGIIKGGA